MSFYPAGYIVVRNMAPDMEKVLQLYCTMCGDRVKIAGKAVLYAESEIYI